MDNNRISQNQAIIMVAMNVIGTSVLIVTGLETKTDIRIAILNDYHSFFIAIIVPVIISIIIEITRRENKGKVSA